MHAGFAALFLFSLVGTTASAAIPCELKSCAVQEPGLTCKAKDGDVLGTYPGTESIVNQANEAQSRCKNANKCWRSRDMVKPEAKRSSVVPHIDNVQVNYECPLITEASNPDMAAQALGYLKDLGETQEERVRLYKYFIPQINELSGGSWTANRSNGADGSVIFTGGKGHALVISPSGDLYTGNLTKIGEHFEVGQGGALMPKYGALEQR